MGRCCLLVVVILALCAAGAAAEPGTGPRESVDQGFTTRTPGSPTGLTFTGVYHAAGDPKGDPPFLRRIVVTAPPGMRYDTSAPERCTASDAQLQLLGPDACPAGSKIGTGTIEGIIYVPFAHGFVFDHFKHNLHVLNNADEQILLVESEGYTVVRGRLTPDGSLEFTPTACFPAPPTGQCADDYVVQLKSVTSIPAITRTSGGTVRSYAVTPPTCPASGSWQTTMRFWWSDGTADTTASSQPCARPAASPRPKHRKRHRHRSRHRRR
jgi:hypothetical protein